MNSETGAAVPTGTSSDLTFGDILRILKRRFYLIVGLTFLGTGLALLYVIFATPIFEASGDIRLDPSREGSLGLSDLLEGGSGSAELEATEVAILQSDVVCIGALNALPDEIFKEYVGEDKAAVRFPENLASLSQQQQSTLAGAAVSLTRKQERILLQFKKSLTVKQPEGTQLITVSFDDKNPQVAATIVNHIISAYLRDNFDSRYASVSQVQTWLNDQLTTLSNKADHAQEDLANFQEANNIIGTDVSNNTIIDRLTLLNQSVAQAQSDRIVKEAQMRAALSGSPEVLESLAPGADMEALQNERASLFTQYAQLSSKFGPKYPPLMETIRQQNKVQSEIKRLTESARQRVIQDYQSAQSAEHLLQSQFNEQAQKAFALNRKQAQYAVLLANATSSRDLYDTLQYKLQQAGIDASLGGVNTMLVDAARTPKIAVAPKKVLVLSFGLIIGLVAGIGAVFLIDATSDKVQHLAEIEEKVGYLALASIPHLEQIGRAKKLIAAHDPKSRASEAYRALRNAILLSAIDNPPKVILVSSSLPGDGKTNTSANLAVVLAQRNAKVLLIDTDLRKPSQQETFEIENKEGLSDYLAGNTPRPNILQPLPDLQNLSLLTAGSSVPFPSEMLGSEKFRQFLKELRGEYDFVVLDSAPMLVVSDSLPLVHLVDTVVLVARFEKTTIRTLRHLRGILERSQAKVSGIVLNDVSAAGADYGYYSDNKYDYYYHYEER